jgi:CRP-like cAMP-binding protein
MQTDSQVDLAKTILGDFLSSSSLKQLVSSSTALKLSPGEFQFREGQENSSVYVLIDGVLDLTMTVPGRGPVRILTLGRGDLVAWSAVLGEGIMTSSAVCVEAANLIAIDSKSVLEKMESDSKFGFEFMKMMATALAKRLLATRLQMLDLFGT